MRERERELMQIYVFSNSVHDISRLQWRESRPQVPPTICCDLGLGSYRTACFGQDTSHLKNLILYSYIANNMN